jgi:hypothetical protein
MDFKKAMAIVGELQTLVALLESQDARWEALQDWLESNPRWRKLIDHYVKITPDEAVLDLRAWLHDQTKIPAVVMDQYITEEVKAKTRAAIVRLQELYKARKRQGAQAEVAICDGWQEDSRPIPSGHKSIGDYQSQLKAKKKRKKRTA